MIHATVHVQPNRGVHPIPRTIFGSFLEHMGRAVYTGVYEPGHPTATPEGYRQDVMQATQQMGVSVIRYPGGNYVSFADWKDAVGPKHERPRTRDFAWRSIETNQFGPDDFCDWCEKIQTEPMLAVNLGTGTPKEAAELVEFTNLEQGTFWADQRARPEPYGVKYWCLGNEMDGPWQAGQVPAKEYALKARAASRLMKGMDPSIKTILSGSSGCFMDTYLAWDREILEICGDDVDLIACHLYSHNRDENTPWFLAEGLFIEKMIEDYRALERIVRTQRRGKKPIKLSFDEWNVWYKAMHMDGGWTEAPALIEEVYNLEDALVVATILNAFIRQCDFLEIACQAQLVNIIAPMLTRPKGLLKQTIYYPFQLISAAAQGASRVDAWVDVAAYDAGDRLSTPYLDCSVFRVGDQLLGCFVNRSMDEEMVVYLNPASGAFGSTGTIFGGQDAKQENTWENPTALVPAPIEIHDNQFTLPPLSFAVLE